MRFSAASEYIPWFLLEQSLRMKWNTAGSPMVICKPKTSTLWEAVVLNGKTKEPEIIDLSSGPLKT